MLDGLGNVYVAGTTENISTGPDYVLIKYDQDGNQIWASTYDGPASGRDYELGVLARDASGNLYISGQSEGVGTGWDCATVKYDSDGNQLWAARYDGPAHGYDAPWWGALALGPQGRVYVCGSSIGFSSNHNNDYLTIAYDSAGNQLWSRLYDGFDRIDFAQAIAVDASGNAYVTGDSGEAQFGSGIATIKYDVAGNQAWLNRIDPPNGDVNEGNALVLDSAGDAYVVGDMGYPYPGGAIGMTKYDTDGSQQWLVAYPRTPGYGVHGKRVFIDANRNLYIAGVRGQPGMSVGYITLKYAQQGVVAVSNFSLIRGILLSGDINDLFSSEDSRLVMRPGVVLSSSEAPVQLIIDGTAIGGSMSQLVFSVESQANQANIQQTVALYNYLTNQYESIDQRIVSLNDSIARLTTSSNPGRFVDTTTNAMQAKVSYKAGGPILSYPWQVRIDQTAWQIIP